jgi:hypothetical protein
MRRWAAPGLAAGRQCCTRHSGRPQAAAAVAAGKRWLHPGAVPGPWWGVRLAPARLLRCAAVACCQGRRVWAPALPCCCALSCGAAVAVGCVAGGRALEGQRLWQLRLGHKGVLEEAHGVGAVLRNPAGSDRWPQHSTAGVRSPLSFVRAICCLQDFVSTCSEHRQYCHLMMFAPCSKMRA